MIDPVTTTLIGAVVGGGSLMLRWVLQRAAKSADEYRGLVRDYQRVTENHIAHNTQALVDIRNTLQELNYTIREIHKLN